LRPLLRKFALKVWVLKMKRLFILYFGLVSGSFAFAQEVEKRDKYDDPRLNTPVPFTLGDRDRLRDFGNELADFKAQTGIHFEAMQKQTDLRFDGMQRQMDVRFEAVDKRLDFMQNLLWAIISIMVALFSGIIAAAVAIFFQFQRINRLLAKHDGILSERHRREPDFDYSAEYVRLLRENEALRRATVGQSAGG
jgi:cell division protein FtsL